MVTYLMEVGAIARATAENDWWSPNMAPKRPLSGAEAFMMIRYRISDSKWESEVLN